MIESFTLLIGVCVALILYGSLRIFFNDSQRLPLPPGPKGLPLLGNLKDLPPPGVVEAFHWLKHKALYGTISNPILILSNLPLILDN